MDEENISIPDFFRGKVVFITGASGFIGKLLIEKLLRCTPDVERIYTLIRPKKGKTAENRIKSILDLDIFKIVREKFPENLKKVIPVIGDASELGLGLCKEDRQKLINEANIVYHAAASVRFDDSLKDAIILNTRGTRETVFLAKELKHLECFVHISTSYCHTDHKVIGEHFYAPHADWRDAILLAEQPDTHTLDILTQKFIDPLPNTYTFTKGLAENVVKDLCEGEMPTVVVRPSIVISTVDDPVPGWIDNFNGPVGILVASGKGILRSVYTKSNIVPDYVPVDIVVKGLLISAWAKCLEKNKHDALKPSVYNFSNNKINNITIGEMVHLGKKICWDYPLNDVLWYPNGQVTSCYFLHFFRLMFYHLLPAIIIDGLLKLLGKKPMLFKVQRKIYIANMALQYFITQEWVFDNEKASTLDQNLHDCDKADFTFPRKTDVFEYFKNALYGGRKYLLNESEESFEAAKRHTRRMWVLSIISDIIFYLVMIYLFFFKWNILEFFWGIVYNYFEKLN